MKHFVIRKVFLSTALFIATIQFINAQSINYGKAHDLAEIGAVFAGSPFSISGQNTFPGDIEFSKDGLAMFILDPIADEVDIYKLTTPFVTTSGVSVNGSAYSVGTQEANPNGIAFSNDGLRMYVTGTSGDDVNAYRLTNPFDLSTGVVVDGSPFSLTSQFSNPRDVAFSKDGSKMFVLEQDQIYQYSLSLANRVNSGVTYDNVVYSIASQDANGSTLTFNEDGTKMFVIGATGLDVNQYNLTTPYSLASGVIFVGSPYSVTTQEAAPKGLAFSTDGSKMYIVGTSGDDVNQYNLNVDGDFAEAGANDGSITGSLHIDITGDTFTSAGGTLASPAKYTITNLPTGLTSSIVVAVDGLSATLSFSGNASDHQRMNNINNLQFNFENSAFNSGDASAILNSTSFQSKFDIDFLNNSKTLTFGHAFDITQSITNDGTPFSVSSQETNPFGITFNNDGTKMFIAGISGDDINQYSLSSPFNITSGVTFDGSPFNVFSEEATLRDITFNTDGTKMYVIGGGNGDEINQFSLSSPFNITSGVSFDGSPFLIFEESETRDLVFSKDGLTLLVLGRNEINQYTLDTPFETRYGVTHTGSPFSFSAQESLAVGMVFSTNGLRLLILGSSGDDINQYSLSTPFDITSGITFDGSPFSISNETTEPRSFAFSANGDKMYMIGSTGGVNQYSLNIDNDFTETAANIGLVESPNLTAVINIIGDTFTNAGSTLSSGSHYSISNLPAGLTPTLAVAAGGLSATLSLSGSVSSHQASNNLEDLIFTFQDGAFTSGNASLVANTTTASSGFDISFTNNPVITYGFDAFDFDAGPTFDGSPFSILSKEASPKGITFNDDGTRMFIIGNSSQRAHQYDLDNPYDVTSGGAFSSSTSIIFGAGSSAMLFNTDGSKLFVLLGSSGTTRVVREYTLATNFDISSTLSLVTSFDVGTEESQPQGLSFNNDGSKMYIVGTSGNEVNQYSLATPFSLSAGVTHDGNSSIGGGPIDIAFSDDGSKMFILGFSFENVASLSMNTPFDITAGFSSDGAFSVAAQDTNPVGLAFSPDGSKMFMIGSTGDDVNQYSIEAGGFNETGTNTGAVEGALTISLSGDTFTNAGGNLSGSDYTINNLPASLTSSISVAVDGLTAQLTFSGTVNNHQNTNDLFSLNFTFENSAFNTNPAAAVFNAVNKESNFGIDFNDNAKLAYGFAAFDLSAGVTNDGSPYSFSSEEGNPGGITFSNDGMKMFIVGVANDNVNQYSLTTAYDVTASVALDGSFSVAAQEVNPTGVQFSADGLKMFVSGASGRDINQYSVSSAYDITSTVIFQGNFSVLSQETTPQDFAFSTDGTKMFVTGSSGDDVNQYTLTTPFDITGTVTFDGSPFSVASEETVPSAIDFSNDGMKMFVLGLSGDDINQYNLTTSFDITSGVSYETTFSVASEETTPSGLAFNADGTKFFVVGQAGDDVNQYSINQQGFTETIANNGSVEGALTISLSSDIFTNASSTLSSPADYSILNLSTGLIPTLTVAADGLSATLTLGGNASSHHNGEDVSSLQFNFTNSAFTNEDAVDVINAVNTQSNFGIDFSGSLNAPTDIALSSSSIDENAASGTTVGNLSTTDVDAGETYTYTLVAGSGATDNASFSITSNQLKSGAIFDFETKTSYSVRINTNDGNGGNFEKIFTITVNNVFETPTDIALSSNSISENEASGTVVGTFSTTDVDAGETYTYTLVTGTGSTDNASFTIDGDEVKSAAMFDFETKTSYSVRVNTNDGNGENFAKPFTISVDNVDDTAPSVNILAPIDNATGVNIASNLILTFSEIVQKGVGSILIKDVSNDATIQTISVGDPVISINDFVVTINLSDLEKSRSYYIEMPPGAFKDATNNDYVGISGNAVWNFSTVLKVAPSITFANISKTYGEAGFDLSAIANSTGDVNYSIVGNNEGTMLTGGNNQTVSIGNVASVTIRASVTEDGNFMAGTKDAILTISKKAITITADAKSKIYGTADPILTHQTTTGSLESGDNITGGLTRAAGNDANTYAISVGTVTAGVNYNLSFVGANLTITQKAITITADVKSKVYGAADPILTHQITSGSLESGDSFTGSLARAAGNNANTYAINVGTVTAGGNYNLSFVSADLTITQKAITITADAKSKVYGTADLVLTHQITTGSLETGDSFTGSLARVAGENVNTYAINVGTVSAGANYNLGFVAANLTITQKAITITADAKSKVYGTSDPSLTYQTTTGSLESGDSFTGSLARTAGSAVNTYAINVGTVSAGGNYNLSFVGANFIITQKAITITADAKSKVYGAADPSLTYQTTTGSLESGDSFIGILARSAGSAVNTYAINVGTVSAGGNYNLSFVGANFTITQKAITITADAKFKVYGAADPSLTYQTTTGSLESGDSFIGSLSRATGEPVNTYVINVGTVTAGVNYSLSFVGANLTITQKAITITADAKPKVYGAADPSLTYQITTGSLESGDSFIGSLARAAGSAVNTYAINVGSVTAGANYNLSFIGANLTITQKAITITADAKSKVYGESDPTLTYQTTSGSLETGDNFTGSLGRAVGEDVNTYAINVGTVTAGGNYDLSYVGANLSITKATLTATADDKTRQFNTANPELTIRYTGFKNSETSTVIDSEPTVSTTAILSTSIGTAPITLSGGNDNNYNFTLIDGTLTISEKTTPTITFEDIMKTYGDVDFDLAVTTNSTGAITYSIIGEANGTTLSGTNNQTVSLGNTGSVTIQVSIAEEATYSAISETIILTINKKAITISADVKSKVFGASDPTLTYQITTGGALKSGDSFTGDLSRAAGEDVNTYAINIGTVSTSSNYNVTYVGADLTITQKTITITADAKTKVYGEADPALTYQTTTGSLETRDSFTGSLARVAGEDAITYAINLGTVTAGANYKVSFVSADLTITQKAITINADAKSKVYGATSLTLSYQITSGSLETGDTFTGKLERVTGEDAGTYAINVGTVTAGVNYNVSYQTADLIITQKAITITADAKSKVYGDADPSLTYQLTSGTLEIGDSFMGDLERLADEDADTYAINVGTATAGSNYNVTYVAAIFSITKATLIATAEDKSRVIETANPIFTISYSGFKNGDTETVIDTKPTVSSTATTSTPESAVAITLAGGSDNNYNITLVNGTLTITNKGIAEITFDDLTKTYGDADFDLSATSNSTGVISYSIIGESNGTTLSGSGNKTVKLGNAGSITIKVEVAATADHETNSKMITLIISKKSIMVTADSKSKVYGATDPALTYQTTTGILETGDSFTGDLVRAVGEDVNTYAINIGTVSAGANYVLNFIGANLTITKATITATADNKSRGFGTANPAFTITYSGFQNGETSAVIDAEPTASTTADENTPVGTTSITLDGGSDNNYDFTLVNGELTITDSRQDQTITFDAIADKVFGDVVFDLSATTSSNLAVTYTVVSGNVTINGSTVTIVGSGDVMIAANQAGNVDFHPAVEQIQAFTVAKASQTISITTIEDKLTNSEPFDVVATTDSGLDLTYSVIGPASIAGIIITLTGETGEVTVTVSQPGNDNYNASSESLIFMVDLTTGIEEELAKVSIFPNPVSNWLTVESATLREISYSIYSQNGNLIKYGNLINNDSRIDVQDLNEGLYLLKIITQQRSTTTKILIKR